MDKRLSNWYDRYLVKNNIDPQTIDSMALYDSALTYHENKQILVDHVEAIIMQEEIDVDQLVAKQEAYELEEITKKNEMALEHIKNSKTPEIEKYYDKMKQYVRMIAGGYSNSLFLVGECAIGKTYNCLRILKEEDADFEYVVGKITPLDLYHTLYENKDKEKVVVFDDTIALTKNDDAMSLLFSALWSSSGNRTVVWRSTSSKLKAPKKFNFEGRIIFTLNEVADNQMMQTLLSRCLTYHLNFNYNERLCLMYEIAKLPHPKLNYMERTEIVEFIEMHTKPSTKDFNLRLQAKLEQMYLFDREKWKSLAMTQIQVDKDLALVQELVESGMTVKDQKREFMKRTGKTERSYFNMKKQLK